MQVVENINLADALGAIKSEIADLKAREESIKASLIERAADGETVTQGALFRATVSFADKPVTSYVNVLAALAVAHPEIESEIHSLVQKHTKVAPMVPTVRVSAKKG